MPWHVLDIHNNIHKSEKNKNRCNMQSFYITLAHDIPLDIQNHQETIRERPNPVITSQLL